MKVTRASEMVKGVAERWKRQYCHHQSGWGSVFGGSSEDIYRKLLAMPDTATPADVAAIIGNTSWASTSCHECGDDVPVTVELGAEEDYESHTACICEPCLVKALAAIQQG